MSDLYVVWDCAPPTHFYGPFMSEAGAELYRDWLEREEPNHTIEVWPLTRPREMSDERSNFGRADNVRPSA